MSGVVIVGAGPGGASLAFLLARRGIDVTLLERQTDFAREFRGEVLLPGGLDPFKQMGLWDELDTVPHVTLNAAQLYVNGKFHGRSDADGRGVVPAAGTGMVRHATRTLRGYLGGGHLLIHGAACPRATCRSAGS
jgi:2-polyprenyl-6-methoxyphenol hydroxylase-like FAD-dependent oxidoreductase